MRKAYGAWSHFRRVAGVWFIQLFGLFGLSHSEDRIDGQTRTSNRLS